MRLHRLWPKCWPDRVPKSWQPVRAVPLTNDVPQADLHCTPACCTSTGGERFFAFAFRMLLGSRACRKTDRDVRPEMRQDLAVQHVVWFKREPKAVAHEATFRFEAQNLLLPAPRTPRENSAAIVSTTKQPAALCATNHPTTTLMT
ncbi:hypothetical protein ACCO45_001781 [Purpureocillium lilacinum]|uniref:Uncharacterized protein n=1 Tax=Purpureocillium lilacinum TaxID=33203 RepID=A0ACC4E832_PURLI